MANAAHENALPQHSFDFLKHLGFYFISAEAIAAIRWLCSNLPKIAALLRYHSNQPFSIILAIFAKEKPLEQLLYDFWIIQAFFSHLLIIQCQLQQLEKIAASCLSLQQPVEIAEIHDFYNLGAQLGGSDSIFVKDPCILNC